MILTIERLIIKSNDYMYLEGQGVKRDPVQAHEWMLAAAKKGYAPAQNYLGVLYGSGRGIDEDPVQAYFWTERSAKQGYGKAIQDLKYLETRMTPEQIEQAKRLADAWQKPAH